MDDITDHAALIDWLSPPAISLATSEKQVTIRAWKARNRIPAEHWPGVIALAAQMDREVTADWLMVTTPPRKAAEEASDPAGAQAAA